MSRSRQPRSPRQGPCSARTVVLKLVMRDSAAAVAPTSASTGTMYQRRGSKRQRQQLPSAERGLLGVGLLRQHSAAKLSATSAGQRGRASEQLMICNVHAANPPTSYTSPFSTHM